VHQTNSTAEFCRSVLRAVGGCQSPRQHVEVLEEPERVFHHGQDAIGPLPQRSGDYPDPSPQRSPAGVRSAPRPQRRAVRPSPAVSPCGQSRSQPFFPARGSDIWGCENVGRDAAPVCLNWAEEVSRGGAPPGGNRAPDLCASAELAANHRCGISGRRASHGRCVVRTRWSQSAISDKGTTNLDWDPAARCHGV
jgi:hypothetical protein